MTIPEPVIGWGALIAALILTFVAPPGRRGRYAVVGSLVVFGLYLTASWFLWPSDNWLVPGIIAGVIGVVIRDIRRWLRFFQGATYRAIHPYYWYSRARRRRRY
ncbi:MAG: hypothetical protein HY260_15155 [Chloroflexi bacterium]|nr:hypothetical protein [Chloroflexota bacterium]